MKEQTLDNLMRGNHVFEQPRYLTADMAMHQLLEVNASEDSSPSTLEGFIGEDGWCGGSSRVFVLARLGSDDALVVSGCPTDLKELDFGPPLHSLVVCAPRMHPMEEEYFNYFHWSNRRTPLPRKSISE
eukprot:GHVR01011540.1.p2 GENE.GHVR01011540.1~~GHVR01011540.1.p2  ORF type:complete len:129 (+),score=31.56 GHVR01011540.1:606-992(+)